MEKKHTFEVEEEEEKERKLKTSVLLTGIDSGKWMRKAYRANENVLSKIRP